MTRPQQTPDDLNKNLQKWANELKNDLRKSVAVRTNKTKMFYLKRQRIQKLKLAGYNIRGESEKRNFALFESVMPRFWRRYGEIERIGISFARHGIYIHHGVGRGRPKTKPGKKIDWFNPIVESKIEPLANIVAQYYGDKFSLKIAELPNLKNE